jgi:alkylation response protein AidB-like acyl-CoA dehydrogenase
VLFPISAKTDAGARLVELAERHATAFATRAGKHDRDGSYPFESLAALRSTRYLAAPVPEEHGGLGVGSTHDILVASSRLARGDASVAIGVNMHLTATMQIVRRWSMAVAAGNERRAKAFAASMEAIARDEVVMAAAISERGQDMTRPSTRATRTAGGWRIDGDKVFCTMSPAATVLYTAVSFCDEDGNERYGYAMVPAGTPGLTVNDDWDALGMRASGSNSVSFDGVELPADALRGGFDTGDAVPYMERNLDSGLFHAAASLGIAESADEASRARPPVDARGRMLVAENAIDLAAARGVLSRAASMIDDHVAAHPTTIGTREEIAALFAEAQAAKAFINESAARVVDRALALSGGAGYVNGHPLSRAYRDVRAGSFMHPLGANRAYEFVARAALGLEPELH